MLHTLHTILRGGGDFAKKVHWSRAIRACPRSGEDARAWLTTREHPGRMAGDNKAMKLAKTTRPRVDGFYLSR